MEKLSDVVKKELDSGSDIRSVQFFLIGYISQYFQDIEDARNVLRKIFIEDNINLP